MGQNQSAIDTSGELLPSRYYYDTDQGTFKLSRKNDDRIVGVLDEPCSYKRMCAPGSPDSEEFSPHFNDSLELSLPLPGHYDSSLFGQNSSLSSTFPRGDIVTLEPETNGSSKMLDDSCKERNLRRPHQPSSDEEVPTKKAKDSVLVATTKEATENIYDSTPSRKSEEKTNWKTPQPIATSTPLHASVKSKIALREAAPGIMGENDRLPAAAMIDSSGATKIGTKLIQSVERLLSSSGKWTPSKMKSSDGIANVPATLGKKVKPNAPPVPVRTTSLQKTVVNRGFIAYQSVPNQRSTSSSVGLMLTNANSRQAQKAKQPPIIAHLSDVQNYRCNQFVEQVEGTPALSMRRPSFPQMGLTPRKKTNALRAVDMQRSVPKNIQMPKPILPILSRPLDVASETNRSKDSAKKSFPSIANAASSQSVQTAATSGAPKPRIRMTTGQLWSQKDAEFYEPPLVYSHQPNNNLNMQMVANAPPCSILSTLPGMPTDASECFYENLPVLSGLPSPPIADLTANAKNNVPTNRCKTSRLSLPARFSSTHNPQPLPPPYRPTMMYKQMLAVAEQQRSINEPAAKPNYGGGGPTFAHFPPSYGQLLI